jgi:hypothetical protein
MIISQQFSFWNQAGKQLTNGERFSGFKAKMAHPAGAPSWL